MILFIFFIKNMDVYQFIVHSLHGIPDNELPTKIEMNTVTHKELVKNMQQRTGSENIISIETLFHLPIFINDKLKNFNVKFITDKSNIDICINCADKYTNIKNYHLLKYTDDNQCELCKIVCKTTKISAKYVDFNKLKSQLKPNI